MSRRKVALSSMCRLIRNRTVSRSAHRGRGGRGRSSAISTLPITWLSVFSCLAGVVQQEREIEQIRLLQLVEELRVALVPIGMRLP